MTSETTATGPRAEAAGQPPAEFPVEWRAARTETGAFGLVVSLVCLGVALFLLSRITGGSAVNLSMVVLAVATVGAFGGTALLGYWTMRYWMLVYRLDRNGLAIKWPGGSAVFPMGKIESMEQAPRLGRRISKRRLAWPGFHLGRTCLTGTEEFTVYSAALFGKHVLVRADARAYAVAPADVEGFLAAYLALRELGPVEELRVPVMRPWPAWRALLTDRVSRDLIVTGVLLSAALLLYLVGKYPSLPSRLPTHWNAAGEVDWIVETREVFYLPIIGLLMLLVNLVAGSWVVRRELMAARLLSGASLFAQLVLWVAVLGIVN